jgi:hypothetical protein
VKKRRRSQSPPLASAVVGPMRDREDHLRAGIRTARYLADGRSRALSRRAEPASCHSCGGMAANPRNRGFFRAAGGQPDRHDATAGGNVWLFATAKSRPCISSTTASNERACICLPWRRFLPCNCKTENSRSCRHFAHWPKQRQTRFQAWRQAAGEGKRRASPPFEAPTPHRHGP